ncbi:hypothetical protein [Streptomyces sp. NPDC059786]|uniref:hypothetical protein n=1 Tax=Streptomyces sp. NPDC059786 TaxID=3346946 RepID=UPI00365D631F
MPLTDHPAGRDGPLYAVLEDLKLDRYLSARELLAATGDNWKLRTFRSLVIALYAARGHAIEAWLSEHPDEPNARMMYARVLTQRVLQARQASDFALAAAANNARQACHDAARAHPADPVPYVCLLALAQLDIDHRRPQRSEHWASPPRSEVLPDGPWPLLWAVRQRDPENREAYQRMLQYFQARRAGARSFAHWAYTRAFECSELLMLPLYVYVDDFLWMRAHQQISDFTYWTDVQVKNCAQRARDGWFQYLDADTLTSPELSMSLNHLAYALTASGVGGAGPVFRAIDRYVTQPWQSLASRRVHWTAEFAKVRDAALRDEEAYA